MVEVVRVSGEKEAQQLTLEATRQGGLYGSNEEGYQQQDQEKGSGGEEDHRSQEEKVVPVFTGRKASY